MKTYTVKKLTTGHPGHGAEYQTRSYPEREVVMSRHSRHDLSVKALAKCRADHSGMSADRFWIDEE